MSSEFCYHTTITNTQYNAWSRTGKGCHKDFDSFREKFVNGYTGAEECVLMNTPLDMVIVMLGTNDCKDFYGAEPEEIGQGLENVGKLFFAERGGCLYFVSSAAKGD